VSFSLLFFEINCWSVFSKGSPCDTFVVILGDMARFEKMGVEVVTITDVSNVHTNKLAFIPSV